MKTLLYKQLRLVCHPMTPVFCLFGFMVIIPNYPYTVIFFYVMLGLFFTDTECYPESLKQPQHIASF